MKKFLIILLLLICLPVYAEKISGTVKQDDFLEKHQVIDALTGKPISGATVSIPSRNYRVKTDADGYFDLKTSVDNNTILSVSKDGYRPFSITIGKEANKNPLKLGIEQSKATDLTIENDLCHLGDDLYSDNSANSYQFKSKAVGPFYSKDFELKPAAGENYILIIGSVIGLDTKMARELGQNRLSGIYSSPTEIFFNGQKIGELNINGDNQEIAIPSALVRQNGNNLTIQTGKNLFQHAYIDYDDIEIMNIRIETRAKPIWADATR